MKICHAFTHIREEDGGLVRSVFTLVNGLVDAGHEVTLATSSNSEFPGLWEAGDRHRMTVVPVEPPTARPHRFARAGIRRIEEVFRGADVVHLHGMWRLAAHQMARAARRVGKPYVISVHGRLDDWSMRHRGFRKRLFFYLLERANLAAAAQVHVTASVEGEQVRRWVPSGSMSIIPYLLDPDFFEEPPDPGDYGRRHPPYADGRPTVLFLSRLHPKKGAEVVIDAADHLRRRGVACRVLLAGPGDPEYVARLRARAAERAPDAAFVGMVTGAEKRALFSFADVFVLPTAQENFGLVLAESLASRTPVITTRGTDIWPELEKGGGAVLVEPTAEAFADAIEEGLRDRDRLDAMGRAGREWVTGWLDSDALIVRYEQMYRASIDG